MKTEEDRTKKPGARIGLAAAAIALFFPTGIPALIRAIKAQMAGRRGEIDLAWKLTDSSVSMSRISIIIGIMLYAVYFGFYIYTLSQIMFM